MNGNRLKCLCSVLVITGAVVAWKKNQTMITRDELLKIIKLPCIIVPNKGKVCYISSAHAYVVSMQPVKQETAPILNSCYRVRESLLEDPVSILHVTGTPITVNQLNTILVKLKWRLYVEFKLDYIYTYIPAILQLRGPFSLPSSLSLSLPFSSSLSLSLLLTPFLFFLSLSLLFSSV